MKTVATGRSRWRPAIGTALALLAVATVLSSCLGGSSGSGAALPSLRSGCNDEQSAAQQAVPFKPETSGGEVVPVVAVCLDGAGPYPFLLSTGAGMTVVSPALVSDASLRRVSGSAVDVRGVTCVPTAPEAAVENWSMGGIRLAGQNVLVANIPSEGLKDVPLGMIGSDVLSRFGAIALDYRTDKLHIAQREGAAPQETIYRPGVQAANAPPFMSTPPKVSVPLRVLESTQGTLVVVPVDFGTQSEQFVVDSGSAGSSMSAATASVVGLTAAKGAAAELWGAGCRGTAPSFSVSTWAIGGSTLPAAELVSQTLSGAVNQGVVGVLGSDVLSSHGEAVIDYSTAHLWLGVG